MPTFDESDLDYKKLLRASRNLDVTSCTTEQRIALLSDAAVPQLVPLLEVLLARRGIRGEIFLGEYDSTEIEVFDRNSPLYQFAPDVVVILNALPPLRMRYRIETEDRASFGERTAHRLSKIWDAIAGNSSATIVQSNLAPPYERLFGNLDQIVVESFSSQILRLNVALADRARDRGVLINDVAGLAARVGLASWLDERLWTLAKAYCALDHLPLVARNIADIVAAKLGQVVKCVVVDLDNTVWGGVIGDDGMAGIELDPYGHGEPYHRLQSFLLELKRRGVVLAVCSKNDHAIAIEAFRNHPDMVLREDDIAAFAINWSAKPDNIAQIREQLEIGFDSMVFLDDNPFERNLVREKLPEVIVPELPEDPADYVRFLCDLNLFETIAFSDEDRKRADLYRQNAARIEAQEAYTDISDYLRSLKMKVSMQRFDTFSLPRIAQLLQRSNQFNLTTIRYSLPECEAMMKDEQGCLPLYLTLSDRFGDNGLISVVILRYGDESLVIDSWLMSCRVLGRGVEQFAMNRVVEIARDRGYRRVEGAFVPTAKNAMVRDFYERFGFERTTEHDGGRTEWVLDVGSYQPHPTYLSENLPPTNGELP